MRLKIILLLGIIITLVLFGVMIHLIRTVNPPPLESENVSVERNEEQEKQEKAKEKDQRRVWHSDAYVQKLPPRIKKNDLNTPPKTVVPPVWPSNPETSPPINEAKRNPQDNIISNVTEVQNKSSTPILSKNATQGDTLVCKRSVSDDEREGDLNSIVLKILDASGKFNIEIKIGSKEAISEEKINTTENRNHSDTPKCSMSMKTKNNDRFKRIKLAKHIIISVMPNDSVTVNVSEDHVIAETEVKNNVTQANIVDLVNITKRDVAYNKSTVMSCKDVYKPVVIFYNQTKLIYNYSDTKAKDIGKGEILKEPNNTSDPKQSKTNLNSLQTANNMDYNMQAEKKTFENETIRLENTTEMDNSTVSTEVFQHKTSSNEMINVEISLANGNSSQNDTRNFIKIEELVHNQQLKFKNMGR